MTIGSHQATVGKSQVHLTPRFILEALGPFDLDPCAATVRPWDCARENIVEAEDGLSSGWFGRVWLNPPFDRYQVGRWVDRLAKHGSGILLVHARTETDWFERVWAQASALLFLADRVRFCLPNGQPQGNDSGAPIVLAGFSATDAEVLRICGLAGFLVERWTRVPAPSHGRVEE